MFHVFMSIPFAHGRGQRANDERRGGIRPTGACVAEIELDIVIRATIGAQRRAAPVAGIPGRLLASVTLESNPGRDRLRCFVKLEKVRAKMPGVSHTR